MYDHNKLTRASCPETRKTTKHQTNPYFCTMDDCDTFTGVIIVRNKNCLQAKNATNDYGEIFISIKCNVRFYFKAMPECLHRTLAPMVFSCRELPQWRYRTQNLPHWRQYMLYSSMVVPNGVYGSYGNTMQRICPNNDSSSVFLHNDIMGEIPSNVVSTQKIKCLYVE